MLFHLARFSLFMLSVMASFALAFHSLFQQCQGDLGVAYETFGTSLLAMFNAMLGGKGRLVARWALLGKEREE